MRWITIAFIREHKEVSFILLAESQRNHGIDLGYIHMRHVTVNHISNYQRAKKSHDRVPLFNQIVDFWPAPAESPGMFLP